MQRFLLGEESGWSSLKVAMESGSHDPGANVSRPSHTLGVNEDLLAFATTDHTSLLGLGNLDLEGMQ